MSVTKIKKFSLGPKTAPNLVVEYGTAPTKFGNCLAAFHKNMLCFLNFYETEPPVTKLEKIWNNAMVVENQSLISPKIHQIFEAEDYSCEIYLKGTEFEVDVWEALLKIKKGATASYEDIAVAVGRPKARRAVGRAIGKNWIAYIVPCHRVIKKDGSIHKYASGVDRKVSMLKFEGAI